MSETNESSYYEIALTNRQVLMSFVVLLSCVMAAFVSGVWVGRKGSSPAPAAEDQVAASEAVPGDLEKLEEFKFFSDQEKGERELKEVVTDPKPQTTLAEDVGSAPPPPSRAAAPPPLPAVRQPPPPPPPTVQAATAPPAAPREGFVIQVLSTRDEARANRILTQLRQGSYPAFLSPVEIGTQVNYRVRIGPYEGRPPAEKAAQEVNRKYKLDTWVTAASN